MRFMNFIKPIPFVFKKAKGIGFTPNCVRFSITVNVLMR